MGVVERIGGQVRFDSAPDSSSQSWPVTELAGLVVRSRLPNLNVVSNVVEIHNTVRLSTGDMTETGLTSLEEVHGDLSVALNSRLRTLTDVDQLRRVRGDLSVVDNLVLLCEATVLWAEGIQVDGARSICPD
jgi:hypothetical protein